MKNKPIIVVAFLSLAIFLGWFLLIRSLEGGDVSDPDNAHIRALAEETGLHEYVVRSILESDGILTQRNGNYMVTVDFLSKNGADSTDIVEARGGMIDPNEFMPCLGFHLVQDMIGGYKYWLKDTSRSASRRKENPHEQRRYSAKHHYDGFDSHFPHSGRNRDHNSPAHRQSGEGGTCQRRPLLPGGTGLQCRGFRA